MRIRVTPAYHYQAGCLGTVVGVNNLYLEVDLDDNPSGCNPYYLRLCEVEEILP